MAVVRLGKSGKGLHFIDDDGRAYVTSVEFFNRLISGKFSSNFIVLTRLPNDVNPSRFPASPFWNPDTGIVSSADVVNSSDEPISNANDALSNKVLKKQGEILVKDVIL